MNLWFRMLRLLLMAWFRPRLNTSRDPSVIPLRVLPTDIDFNLHMTNGRYLSIADLGRVDLALRTGIARIVARNGWVPIVTFNSVLYRRELRVWRRYDLISRLCFWNDEIQIFEHKFVAKSGRETGRTAAVVLSAAAFYDRRAREFVVAQRLFGALGVDEHSPPATPEVASVIEAFARFKDAYRPPKPGGDA